MTGTLMRSPTLLPSACLLLVCFANGQTIPEVDPIATLVGRLDLTRYKATIRGLTKFGDRRQGTDRNRAAIDWIEAQLKSYGCTNTERIHYEYHPPAGRGRGGNATADPADNPDAAAGAGRGGDGAGRGGADGAGRGD